LRVAVGLNFLVGVNDFWAALIFASLYQDKEDRKAS
jgi:hypothetical protein